MSNVGRWSGWATSEPVQLGPLDSYQKLVEWLDGYGDIADWGGGTGLAARFVRESAYRVIDGSLSLANTELIDLADCTSVSDCIMMRHVLEHNYNWQNVLKNLVKRFNRRAAIAIGTPLETETRLHHVERVFFGSVGQEVPVLCLSLGEFLSIIEPYFVKSEHPGWWSDDVPDETIFYLEKK